MRRIWIYGLLLAVTLAVPTRSNELGKLHPVELVFAYREDGLVVLETDTGAKGSGVDTKAAIQNLKDTTAGIVFLDTADYLLIGTEAEVLLGEMKGYLKKSTRVCNAEQTVNVEEAAGYLSVHTPKMELGQWSPGISIGKLKNIDGRLFLNEK